MRRRALAVALAVAALTLPAACSINPVTGRPQFTVLSKGMERTLSEREAVEVEAQLGVVDAEALATYVEAVGRRVGAASPRQDVVYTFRVIDRPEPNAFALPAGQVYVTRGLLALLNSEDELAGVLGHEIGHVAARHTARRATVAAPFALVFGLPAAIVGVVSRTLGAIVNLPNALAQGLVVAPYSRAQERQADDVGTALAASAGYDPGALGVALRTLEREDALQRAGGERPSDFLDSHPSTRSRVAAIAQRSAALERSAGRPVAPDRRAFLEQLDGLLLASDPEEGVFEGPLFLHPALGFRMPFPEAWQRSNQESAVVAVEPEDEGRTFVVLQLVTESDDPNEGVKADRVSRADREHVRDAEVNGLRAARLTARRGGHFFDVAWIALGGRVYRVSGVCPEDEADRFSDTFDASILGFAALGPEERRRIHEQRLRLHEARPGEDLAALLERAGSPWSVEEAAVANALDDPSAPLPGGRPIKVARSEPWTPAAPARDE